MWHLEHAEAQSVQLGGSQVTAVPTSIYEMFKYNISSVWADVEWKLFSHSKVSHLSKKSNPRTNVAASLPWGVTRAWGGKPRSDGSERMGLIPALRASGSTCKSSPVTETWL